MAARPHAHCAFCAREIPVEDLRLCRRCRRTFHALCCDHGHEGVVEAEVLTGVCLLCSSGLGLTIPPLRRAAPEDDAGRGP